MAYLANELIGWAFGLKEESPDSDIVTVKDRPKKKLKNLSKKAQLGLIEEIHN